MEDAKLCSAIRRASTVEEIQRLGRERFVECATLKEGTSSSAPFIIFGDINVTPRRWVVDALMQLGSLIGALEDKTYVLTMPTGASWMKQYLHLSYGEYCQRVDLLKIHQLVNQEESCPRSLLEIPVRSYTKNRSAVGERGIDPMYLCGYENLDGANVLLLDDAIAEGFSLYDVGSELKILGVNKLHAAVGMSKHMQGGLEMLRSSGLFEHVIAMIEVEQVNPDGKEIFSFHAE